MGKFKIFKTISGAKVIVGRNSNENDELTFAVASISDFWFHVSQYAGSHVVLQKDNPTKEDIQFAANLAVKYSKAKDLTRAKVDYCNVIDVEHPKNAPTGLVLIKNHKTLYGFPQLMNFSI
jgi:predicted ribosome quality control (RQC) complex YloA/Tae2 family protein